MKRYKSLSASFVVVIVSGSVLLWADGENGVHICLSCIFNGFHSLYIQKKKDFFLWFGGRRLTSDLRHCFLSLCASPPLTVPSDNTAKDIWHRAEEGRSDC